MHKINRTIPKYRQVLEKLQKGINSGTYKDGEKLPSEAALTAQFQTSRITVGRALRELQQKGLVERRAGSGTYVSGEHHTNPHHLFGLLIPDLGHTEIFEPICEGMSQTPQTGEHALLWGHTMTITGDNSREERAWQLCRQYIARKVSGVFFAPLEFSPARDETNRQIAAALDKAGIPIVLLDRGLFPYPERSNHDLVGIDNRRAGYMITRHLLRLGCRRIAFLAPPGAASTVDARIGGYREALFAYGGFLEEALVQRLDAASAGSIQGLMETLKPEAFVCANDRTAGRLMQTLLRAGYRVPEDIRITGIDDVGYANLLPVPLTTIRQPCREIGEVAMGAMLERVLKTHLPPREILLDCALVVRQSCGENRAP